MFTLSTDTKYISDIAEEAQVEANTDRSDVLYCAFFYTNSCDLVQLLASFV